MSRGGTDSCGSGWPHPSCAAKIPRCWPRLRPAPNISACGGSQAPISEVLAALQDAGFAPAAEDSTGTIVDIRARGARVPTPQRHRPHRPMPRPSTETLSAVVAVLRKVTTAPFGSVRIDPAVAMSLLQRAARQDETVLINYVDAAGVATQRGGS